MKQQDLYLTHLKMASRQTTLFQLQKGEESHWLKGKWAARGGQFRINLQQEELPFEIEVGEAFTAQVRLLDDTGVHSFEASLHYVAPKIFELNSLGPIAVEQRRIFIRLPVETRVEYRLAGQEDSELAWGIVHNLSPNGMAFEALAEFAEGDLVEILFREEPWVALEKVIGRIAGRRSGDAQRHLYRLVFKDMEAAKTLIPLIVSEYSRQIRERA